MDSDVNDIDSILELERKLLAVEGMIIAREYDISFRSIWKATIYE
jgi:hypothetical protein